VGQAGCQVAKGGRLSAAAVSQVRCRYCGEVLVLNPDGEAARAAGSDPHQQIRRHILDKHQGWPENMLQIHMRRIGWLIDMMFFESVNDPAKWRKQIAELVDYLLSEEVG
jgi:hypothetical protein